MRCPFQTLLVADRLQDASVIQVVHVVPPAASVVVLLLLPVRLGWKAKQEKSEGRVESPRVSTRFSLNLKNERDGAE